MGPTMCRAVFSPAYIKSATAVAWLMLAVLAPSSAMETIDEIKMISYCWTRDIA